MKTLIFISLLFFSPIAYANSLPPLTTVEQEVRTTLNLQENQIGNVNAVLSQYYLAREQSPSQNVNEQETQAIEQYLLPYQVTEWRTLQSTIYSETSNTPDNDDYSNLPYASGDMVVQ